MNDKAFTAGDSAEQIGDCEKWAAYIDDQSHRRKDRSAWYSRIRVLGDTAKEAEELRDLVLDALNQRSEPAWVGVGLPPVGTVCEVQTWVNREWRKTTVLAHHLGYAVHSWSTDGDDIEVEVAPAGDFRPFRTPEQIAEEERRGHIATLVQHICADGAFDVDDPEVTAAAAKIYDAGYRKQVAP